MNSKFAVIGLGVFGSAIARKLAERGAEDTMASVTPRYYCHRLAAPTVGRLQGMLNLQWELRPGQSRTPRAPALTWGH